MNVPLWQLHLCAFLFRIGLVLYGEWQDRNFELKFTDVDYHVFTDAAEYVSNRHSPYLRPTYRYSPLLAWMLVPCHTIHMLWGKLVFIASDLLAGWLIQKTLQLKHNRENVIKVAVSLWLFNPISMTISSRGNAESIMSVLVLGSFYALCRKCTILSGMIFAVSVHLKVFPLVTALAIYLFLGSGYAGCKNELKLAEMFTILHPSSSMAIVRKLLSKERLEFFLSSFITFSAITWIFYFMYGFEFLEHAYLYHVTRKDIRHNFSIYFYMLYTNSEWWLGLVCFINQVIVTLCLSFAFYRDLPFCCFLLTFSFVAFNKICTSQYFLWYLTVLPLLLPGLKNVGMCEIITMASAWASAQSVWLGSAYALEFQAQSVFLYVWAASVLFFAVNVTIIIWFIKRYSSVPTFNVISGQNNVELLKKRT